MIDFRTASFKLGCVWHAKIVKYFNKNAKSDERKVKYTVIASKSKYL